MKFVVVGAGAFGGWIATFLQQRGARVTLVDAWGPGNSRSSSGGETRIIRAMYGGDAHYTRMASRALQLWQEYEQRWQTKLLHPCGMLLMAGPFDEFIADSSRVLREQGVAAEELSPRDARQRFPQICFDGIDSVLFEPGAGVLTARENCRTVVEKFVAAGGEYRTAQLSREVARSGEADGFIFACGPWLPKLFPELLGNVLRPSKQEVLFFAPKSGDASFNIAAHPVWADRTSEAKYYGIPDFQNRGFKIAADVRGAEFDPDSGERLVAADVVRKAAAYIARRFPALANATLTESRVCQYENTPDFDFIVDRHPDDANVWIAGGGSGHGYKHGPALGEYVAKLIADGGQPDPEYKLDRFTGGSGIAPLSSF